MYLKKWIPIAVVAALVSACGGGGGSAGTSPYGTSAGTTSTTSGSTSTSSNTSGSLVLSLSNSAISSSAPGTVTALVKDASGAVVPGAVVTFALTNSSIAGLSTTSGMTDSSGATSTTVTPVGGVTSGAGYVTASVTLAGTTTALTAQYAFSVAPVNVALTSVAAHDASTALGAYASKALDIVVSAATSSAPVTLTVSSTCATSGKAIISPATLTLTSTTGSVTYQDKGCAATDQVNVQIQGSSQSKFVRLVVAPPVATSLSFVPPNSPVVLALMGSGGAATAEVKFRVVDNSGTNGIANKAVKFVLDQTAAATLGGDTTGSGTVNGTTDASGYVSVVVTSKTVPTPVRVIASLVDDPTISTVSNALTILAGLPYQNGVSVSAKSFTVNYNLDGDSTQLTVRLVDRFGNPVPDGTVVNFISEGGSVTPGTCSTGSGACTVNFVVQNPRPADGRVTVVAYAQGEEDFVDNDNSNTYTPGDGFTPTDDLGKVFIDSNENNQIDAGELTIGNAANGKWDSNAYVRNSFVMVMSNTVLKPRLSKVSGGACTQEELKSASVVLTAQCKDSVYVCVRDGNTNADKPPSSVQPFDGNPILAGSTSTLLATSNATGSTATVDNSPISPDTIAPTIHQITVARTSCATPLTANGTVDLNITVAGKTWLFSDLISVTK